jgi:hypothetical protein
VAQQSPSESPEGATGTGAVEADGDELLNDEEVQSGTEEDEDHGEDHRFFREGEGPKRADDDSESDAGDDYDPDNDLDDADDSEDEHPRKKRAVKATKAAKGKSKGKATEKNVSTTRPSGAAARKRGKKKKTPVEKVETYVEEMQRSVAAIGTLEYFEVAAVKVLMAAGNPDLNPDWADLRRRFKAFILPFLADEANPEEYVDKMMNDYERYLRRNTLLTDRQFYESGAIGPELKRFQTLASDLKSFYTLSSAQVERAFSAMRYLVPYTKKSMSDRTLQRRMEEFFEGKNILAYKEEYNPAEPRRRHRGKKSKAKE